MRFGFVVGFALGIAVGVACLVAIIQVLGAPPGPAEIVYCVLEVIGCGLVVGLLGAVIEAVVRRRG